MARSLPRRIPLFLLSFTVALATATAVQASTPPPAITPIHAVDPSDAPGARISADFTHWTPAAGAPARFIAEAFVHNASPGLWIGLGYTDAGFWSAEAETPNDACDSCDKLDLVVTGFDGKRRSFPVITITDQERLSAGPADAIKTLALTRLWHLALKDWPAAQLQQDYGLRFAPRDATGVSDPYPGWMAETTVRGKGLLRFALRVDGHVMCWSEFGWHGWNLASPRKR